MAPEDGSMELGSGFKRPQLDTELSAESFAGDLSSPLGAGFTKTLTMFSPLSSENVILAADDVSTSFTHIRRHFKGYEIIEAANGDEAVEKAREAAMAGTPIKLFLMDFRMPRRNGGQASVAIRDIEVKGKKPYENSIFICLSATPEDAAPYQIKDLDGSLSGRERDPLEVFHQVRGKIEKPKDAKDVLEFTNRLLVRAFTFAGEAMDSLVK